MHSFSEFVTITEQTDYPVGTILHVSSGSMFSEKNLAVLRTADGWKQINDYGLHGNQPRGLVGDDIDIKGMNVKGVLHKAPVAGKIDNIFQIAALPEKAKILVVNKTLGDKEYRKVHGKWVGPEGKSVEYFHFDPHALQTTVVK